MFLMSRKLLNVPQSMQIFVERPRDKRPQRERINIRRVERHPLHTGRMTSAKQ